MRPVKGEGDTSSWQPAPDRPVLSDGEVHVWRARLAQPLQRVETLAALLSPEEHERASRFYFDRHRSQFIVGRGILRIMLGRYLNLPAREVRLSYSALGKPYLSAALMIQSDGLQFNLAHVEGMAFYAVTRCRAIGVDLERLRPLPDAGEIAQRFFSPGEVAAFRNLAPGEQLRAFFRCWTRKEAFLKATGDGLGRPLDDFEVSLAPEQPARLLRVFSEPGATFRWSLRDVSPEDDLVAAIAVEGPLHQLTCYDFP